MYKRVAGWGAQGVETTPRCWCLPSKVCNAPQSPPIPFSHMRAWEHTMVAFSGRRRVCSVPFNLSFIQMRIKCPRLFKEYTGSVDLNKHRTDGVCFYTVVSVCVEISHVLKLWTPPMLVPAPHVNVKPLVVWAAAVEWTLDFLFSWLTFLRKFVHVSAFKSQTLRFSNQVKKKGLRAVWCHKR